MGNWLAEGGWQSVSHLSLAAWVIAAALVDLRQRRIPNVLVFSGAAMAVLLAHLPGGSLTDCLAGIAVGLGATLPFYVLRAMGAGDVKLMAMAGGFLGAAGALAATLLVFVVGGVFALLSVARRRAFGQLAASVRAMAQGAAVGAVHGPAGSVGAIPYGVAIAVGTLLYLALLRGGIFA